MAARAIGTSSISFGLVTIPVKLFATSSSGARVSFNWIDRKTGVRVRQQYFNPDNNEVVPKEDMVKGYQFAKNQFVILEPDELKVLEQPKTDAIEIAEFVPAEQVERVYYDRAYYLGPDRGGARAYRLLAAALEQTGRVAVARFATRGKQYLVMVRPYRDGLMLEQLRYKTEVRSWDEIPVEEGEINPAELDLAVQMIEQKTADEFQPDDYRDEVRERQLELIQQKIDGEQITVAPSAEPQAQIIDLMAALKASIAGEGGGSGSDEGAAEPRRKAAAG
jgi:DNA end-binding protein Ku